MNTVETGTGRRAVAGSSRRGFLEGIGVTAFLLAFQVPINRGRAGEPSGIAGQLNTFLAIGEDDLVTVVRNLASGGQSEK